MSLVVTAGAAAGTTAAISITKRRECLENISAYTNCQNLLNSSFDGFGTFLIISGIVIAAFSLLSLAFWLRGRKKDKEFAKRTKGVKK